MDIAIKRAYEAASPADGARVLVDRLWPRGIKKEVLQLDLWCKDIAPSPELRKWFCHQADKFAEFTQHYRQELEHNTAGLAQLQPFLLKGRLSLIYAARDPQINHAVVLQDWLQKKLSQ
ncbi:DUF488 domain-containing protein [Lampropedia aestuarii]|uniref:DUF488 domain-containing protein n=1 Tax=Lampropedia aestuarii TaxID=2562762 RepID=A0A4S5BPV9_9BURK|nr:DUF488 domain-containing protein [Lampropedia aestuarii]MDH5858266.1 DUF488 domain-containing protein [Lampropedia aestuarii]THJ32971.1 DUF488 domain-containing protein [Lampropedia aestuarii]